ncbi:TnsA endonuclease N-terminal domain-containing protein [Gottfriedia sp. NPDC057991]|uniref:TnsA endonuclease N-terminal domain-containing protein n=1 Tax=Gottfriedia sp. NPDC057991 TaxID=3346298 RepID=UPI0036DD6D72
MEFCEQPLKIEYEYEGKKRASIFEMWVKFRDGSEEFREIKYKSMLQNDHENYDDTMRQIQLQKNGVDFF